MTKSHRYITSLFMTAVYLLIVFSPLTSLAMQSKTINHAVTGECSGDCSIDGCSLEQSAAHACCCWQKKQRGTAETHLHSNEDTTCTPPTPPAKSSKKKLTCCDTQAQSLHETSADSKSVSTTTSQKPNIPVISSRTCGSGKIFVLLSIEASQYIPFMYTEDFSSPEQTTLTFISPKRLTSRCCDPPVPPPQTISHS